MKEYDVSESGFINNPEEEFDGSPEMTDVEILHVSDSYVTARGRRYGRWWRLKALSETHRDIPEERRRLHAEFEILSHLLGPCVAQFVGIEDIDGLGPCIVEEWVEGKTLSTLLQEGSLRKQERKRIMGEIIKSVGFIHSKGVAHGNLDPSNVLLRNVGGSVVLLNFASTNSESSAVTDGSASSDAYAADIAGLGKIMQSLAPEYGDIARRCIGPVEKRPKDTAELIKSLDRHDRIPKIIWAAMGVGLLFVLGVMLAGYINKLNNTSLEAQEKITSLDEIRRLQENRVEELKDSILALNERMKLTAVAMEKRDSLGSSRKRAYLAACGKIDKYIGDFEKNVLPLFPVPVAAFYDSINAMHSKLQYICDTAYEPRRYPELEQGDKEVLYKDVEHHYFTSYSIAFTLWQARMYANTIREKRKITQWPPKEVIEEILMKHSETSEKEENKNSDNE